MAERTFASEIRTLVRNEVPSAPWLEDRIMDVVRTDAAARRTERWWDGRPRLLTPALAAAIIAVLAVVALVGSRLVAHSTPAPAGAPTPSKDAAIVRYRSAINVDERALLTQEGGPSCVSRQCTIAGLTNLRAEADRLLQDVDSTPPPAAVAPAAAQLKIAATNLIQQTDGDLALMQDPSTTFLSITWPDIKPVLLEVATINCWPVTPIARSDMPDAYGCTAGPPLAGRL